MSLFTSTEFNSLQDLLVDQVKDLYDAEQRLTSALPEMEKAANCEQLAAAFRNHLRETETQIGRLERVFGLLGVKPKGKTCEAMKGLISEGEEMVNANGDEDVRDAALIAAAQRVKHYEIAAYGCTRHFAIRLGMHEIAELLQETLDEEKRADEKLTDIAINSVNVRATST